MLRGRFLRASPAPDKSSVAPEWSVHACASRASGYGPDTASDCTTHSGGPSGHRASNTGSEPTQ